MKGIVSLVSVCLLFLAGCENDKSVSSDAKSIQSNKKQQQSQAVKEMERPKSLRDLKKGEFMSSKMLPLSELDPETNEDIYVHLVGRVVNLNKQQTWAVIQGGDSYYFAFGHAGIEMMKTDLLGQEVYVRAIVELNPLNENTINHVQNGGLAPGKVPATINRDYQFNTTKIASINAVDKEVFMGINK